MDLNRRAAFLILKDIQQNNAFSNLVLNGFLEKENPPKPAFVRQLVYGCLRNALLLDYNINLYLNSPKLKEADKAILRMGFYQIVYMDSVPQHSAVDSCVELAKSYAKGRDGFINAVLRNFIRSGATLQLPGEEDTKLFLSVKYSCHQSIVGLFLKAYGRQKTEEILAVSLQVPPLTTRISAFTGKAVIQGKCSIRAVETLGPKPGQTVIDLCAAPGGKSCYMAELMQNKGIVYARDIYPARVNLINKKAAELGINIIQTKVADGSILDPELTGIADCVLVDAPCSGLGTIAKKPELKLRGLSPELPELYKLQAKLIYNGSCYVKPGGKLLYSTCTINPRENENITTAFLGENPEFALVSQQQFFPQTDGTDGFYICLMQKQ